MKLRRFWTYRKSYTDKTFLWAIMCRGAVVARTLLRGDAMILCNCLNRSRRAVRKWCP